MIYKYHHGKPRNFIGRRICNQLKYIPASKDKESIILNEKDEKFKASSQKQTNTMHQR